jgi:hypothetical protein
MILKLLKKKRKKEIKELYRDKSDLSRFFYGNAFRKKIGNAFRRKAFLFPSFGSHNGSISEIKFRVFNFLYLRLMPLVSISYFVRKFLAYYLKESLKKKIIEQILHLIKLFKLK